MFKRHWFLICLALILALGFSLAPVLRDSLDWIPRSLVVAATLYAMALSLDAHTIWLALRHPWAVLLAVVMNYGVMPLFAWMLSPLLPVDLAVGLMVAASVPSTMASAAVWTRRAGGNDAVAILVTMVTSFFCFLATPTILWLTTGATDFQLPVGEMMEELALVVCLPMVLGQLSRLLAPARQWADTNRQLLGVLAQTGILSLVLVGAANAGMKLRDGGQDAEWTSWALMLASVVGVHVAVLAAGHGASALFGLSRPDRIAVGFSGSQKTLMIGLDVALEHFGGLAMLPMVSYHVVQLVIDALVADRLKRSDLPAKSPGDT